jgi:excisionase family DNA binding protein
MTVLDVASKLYVNPETVRRWIRKGELAAYRMGDYFEIAPEAVQKFVNTHTKYQWKYKDSIVTQNPDETRYDVLNMRLTNLEAVACGLKSQHEYIMNEINELKAMLNQQKGE